VPAEHPLRAILPITDAALAALSGDFEQLYAVNGRPSIAPENWPAPTGWSGVNVSA
jgi:hypothetical protein